MLIVAGLLATWWVASQNSGKLTNRSLVELSGVEGTPAPATPGRVALVSPPTQPSPSVDVQRQRFTAAFLTPITFYGRVVDQHGAPISGADVKLSANDKILRPSSEYTRKTDQSGNFEISGIVGLALAVAVSKPGYLKIPHHEAPPTSSGLFDYGVGTRPHQPDKSAPVVFRLYKLGKIEPLVKIGEKNFRIARDGTPLSIAVEEQGAHQVILRCWNQELQRPVGQRQYDWRFEINVPNGGLLVRNDAFAFEAPQEGYASSDTVEMPASLGNQWRSFAERSYFIRFADGTFARAKLEMQAGGDHFVVWESFYNPKAGSPNLESTATDQSASR